MRIADIKIGERHRKDFGDVGGLARNIAEIGLLHPPVVRPDGTLIAGERRLKALQLLGHTDTPVYVLDLDRVARGEYAENHFRKAFSPSEYADIADELEPVERAAAKERMLAGKPLGNFPGGGGRALDKIARLVGKDRKTIEKARAVRDAAREDPERFGKLQADMDRTGRVDGPFNRLKVARQAIAIRNEPPPLPGNGPYRVAVVDLPWPYEKRDNDPSHRAVLPYPTMAIADMRALPIVSIMHADSILWLWAINNRMRDAYEILDAWGMEPKTILTWAKDKMGKGDWLRGQTEHCIMAVRGKPVVTLTNQTTLLRAPVRGHSQKPVEFYDLVESLCPAPRYADLFSRYRHNDSWDCHGDEAPAIKACAAA
jgi:N6-adenosine-specific RNA methylase IME4